MATPHGLEPSTSSVTGWRDKRLHHEAMWWWEQQRSNLSPPACKADALPAELCSRTSRLVLLTSATWFIIHRLGLFVKHFFRNFLPYFYRTFLVENPGYFIEFQHFSNIVLCCGFCSRSRGSLYYYLTGTQAVR